MLRLGKASGCRVAKAAPAVPPRVVVDDASCSLSKRSMLLQGTTVALVTLLRSDAAMAETASGKGMARYIRRKQLDPLETYVPIVLEAREQLARAGESMKDDAGAARELLRSGPFSKLRDNVRALGEYAAQNGQASMDDATKLVNGFFRSLDAYDYLLYQAVRDKSAVNLDDATPKLEDAIAAFDKLISTVPADILDKSKKILAEVATKASSARAAPAPDRDILEELL